MRQMLKLLCDNLSLRYHEWKHRRDYVIGDVLIDAMKEGDR